MIAIYDQHGIREIISIWPEPEKKSKLRANVRYFHADADTVYFETFDFNTKPQAQYVLDQIAAAIEHGDKLFRMPSAEEVGYAVNHDCEECKKLGDFTIEFIAGSLVEVTRCSRCNYKKLWQPKE